MMYALFSAFKYLASKTFSQQAEVMGIKFSLVHKKVNVANVDVAWEHEHYSKKHFTSATISGLSAPADNLLRSNIFDSRYLTSKFYLITRSSRLNRTTLTRNVQFIGEVLAKFAYNISDPKQLVIYIS